MIFDIAAVSCVGSVREVVCRNGKEGVRVQGLEWDEGRRSNKSEDCWWWSVGEAEARLKRRIAKGRQMGCRAQCGVSAPLSAQTWTKVWAGIGTRRQESNTLGCL